jgi:oligoendopeptidase F
VEHDADFSFARFRRIPRVLRFGDAPNRKIGSAVQRNRRAESGTSFVDEAWIDSFERIIIHLNALSDDLETLGAYIACFVTTDAGNDRARALESELETRTVILSQLQPRLVAWVGSSDVETLLQNSQIAREHEGWIRRAQQAHKHQMSESEENLAASLSPMGLSGWAKLHGQISALLEVKVQVEGEEKRLPMSAIRALASDSNRETRRAAFDAEIKSWQSVAPTMAACLNGIKGFQREVRSRRGFVDDVAPTLARNFIDETILGAMQDACVSAFPDFRRYMKAKARALKLENLAWFDLIAPLEGDEDSWDWPETERFTIENFGRYSSRLADFARRAFVDEWIDAAPRVAKLAALIAPKLAPANRGF